MILTQLVLKEKTDCKHGEKGQMIFGKRFSGSDELYMQK